MHRGLHSRIEVLERCVSHNPRIVLLMVEGETEEQTLAKHGHSPGTEAMFIKLVAFKENDRE